MGLPPETTSIDAILERLAATLVHVAEREGLRAIFTVDYGGF